MEFAGTVYICPYCRVQRTVILLLGVAMILPFTHHWIVRFIASVVGFLGAVVAVNQNFMGWVKISKGTFAFNEALYIDPFSPLERLLVYYYRPTVAHTWQRYTSLSADTVTLPRGSKAQKPLHSALKPRYF